MKKTMIISLAIGLLLSIHACKKCPALPCTKPLQDYVKDSTLYGLYTSYYEVVFNYENGYEFYVSKDGDISKLGVNLPVTGTYTVSLWGADSKQLLKQSSVTVATAGSWAYSDIDAYRLLANKRYVLSVNLGTAGKTKLLAKSNQSNVLPFVSHYVHYVNSRGGNPSATPAFPDNTAVTSALQILAMPDICFTPIAE